MSNLTSSEVNQNKNEIPIKYNNQVLNHDKNLVAGSIAQWEDPMGLREVYVALYDKDLVIFTNSQEFIEDGKIEIPLTNIFKINPSRAKGFLKSKKIYEVEFLWYLTDAYLQEYNKRKNLSELNMIDMMLSGSAYAVEAMMGIKDATATLLVGEIKGTGMFNSFGYVSLELLKKRSQFSN
jgi:predicted nucleic-acid-binding protein